MRSEQELSQLRSVREKQVTEHPACQIAFGIGWEERGAIARVDQADAKWFIESITKYVLPGECDTPDAAYKAFRELSKKNLEMIQFIMDIEPSVLPTNHRERRQELLRGCI